MPSPRISARAVIFDLDGLLIDSEPLWERAEIEVFAAVGVRLDAEACKQTQGLRVDEVVDFRFAERPWSAVTSARVAKADVVARIADRVVALIGSEGVPMAGALDVVRDVGGRFPIALASSSSRRIIDAALLRLGLEQAFDVVHSAEAEALGKPHPAVYLSTARLLGVDPASCVALEDSLNGLVAAKAARMRCVCIPEPRDLADRRFGLADVLLPSLEAFDPSWLNPTE